MLYLLTFGNKKVYKFLEGECIIIDCKNGVCPKGHFRKKDWVLTMMPVSKFYKTPKGGNRLNPDEAILLSKNKPLCRKILQKEKINIPKTWYDIKDAIIPYLARPEYHKQGKEFYVVRNKKDHEEFLALKIHDATWYYSELINLVREIRAIVLDDKVIFTYEFPVFSSPEETVLRRHEVMGTTNDPGYKSPRKLMTKEQEEMCIRAVHAIGLKYGTADLMFDEAGNYYICEINYHPHARDYVKPHIIKGIREFKKKNNIG